MQKLSLSLVVVAATLSMLPLSAAAKPGDVDVGLSYSDTNSTFKPETGNRSKTNSDGVSLSVSYQLGKAWTLSGNVNRQDVDSKGTNNSVRSESETDIYGILASYKFNRNLSVFGGYSYGDVETKTVITPQSVFFDNDISLDVYTAGVSYFNVHKSFLYGLTGLLTYASADLDDYLLQTGATVRPGKESSVTTQTLVPTLAYVKGPMVYSLNYALSRKNRAGGAEPDDISGKAKLGVKYRIGKKASVGLTYSEVVAKNAVDSETLSLKLGYKF